MLNVSHRRFFLDCHASPERAEWESSSPLSEVQEGLPPAGRCPHGHVALGSSCTACSLSFGRAVSPKQSYRQEMARLRQCPYGPAGLTSRPLRSSSLVLTGPRPHCESRPPFPWKPRRGCSRSCQIKLCRVAHRLASSALPLKLLLFGTLSPLAWTVPQMVSMSSHCSVLSSLSDKIYTLQLRSCHSLLKTSLTSNPF